MRKKVRNIIILIIAVCLFVTVIVLTNDKFKTMYNTEKIIPCIIFLMFILIGIILICLLHSNSKQEVANEEDIVFSEGEVYHGKRK